jgi:hypothetical protein
MIQIRFISIRIFLIGIRVSPNETDEADMWVEFKCPICGRDLDDDKSMANFMVCNESSHETLRFFTVDGCFFTSNEKMAEELVKKGKRVHIVNPREFFARQD